MSRPVTIGIARRSNDPLARHVAAALRATNSCNRLHDSSAISLAIEELRNVGADPLNATEIELDRALPPGSRLRTRAWRPLTRVFHAAEQAQALGPDGQRLLARMAAGPTGRRNHLAAYRHYAATVGVDPGRAPAELREHFLLALNASGVGPDQVAAAREAIRRIERAAIAEGNRCAHLPRTERLIRSLLAGGVEGEAEALRLIAASHAPYARSVHRWIDAVTARFLRWCSEQKIQALSAGPEIVLRFSHERGDALGMRPLVRLLEAAQGGGHASCPKLPVVEPSEHDDTCH